MSETRSSPYEPQDVSSGFLRLAASAGIYFLVLLFMFLPVVAPRAGDASIGLSFVFGVAAVLLPPVLAGYIASKVRPRGSVPFQVVTAGVGPALLQVWVGFNYVTPAGYDRPLLRALVPLALGLLGAWIGTKRNAARARRDEHDVSTSPQTT